MFEWLELILLLVVCLFGYGLSGYFGKWFCGGGWFEWRMSFVICLIICGYVWIVLSFWGCGKEYGVCYFILFVILFGRIFFII